MNTRNRAILICWLAMIAVFLLDLTTTIIGVEILGANETNPFASRLFELGVIGYPLVFIVYAVLFYCSLTLLGLLYRASYKGITNNKLNIKTEIAMYCLIASVYVFSDFVTVIQNIWKIVEAII